MSKILYKQRLLFPLIELEHKDIVYSSHYGKYVTIIDCYWVSKRNSYYHTVKNDGLFYRELTIEYKFHPFE